MSLLSSSLTLNHTRYRRWIHRKNSSVLKQLRVIGRLEMLYPSVMTFYLLAISSTILIKTFIHTVFNHKKTDPQQIEDPLKCTTLQIDKAVYSSNVHRYSE